MQLFLWDFDQPKSFDARRINNPPTIWQRVHFCKGGGVLAFVVRIRNFGGFQRQPRNQLVDQRALSNALVSRNHAYLILHHTAYSGDANAVQGVGS